MSAGKPSLWLIATRRLIPFMLWTIGVAAASVAVVRRQPHEIVYAAKDLPAGHELTSCDFRTDASDKLVGHFLARAAIAGIAITPEAVDTAASLPPKSNAVGAMVSLAANLAKERKLDIGTGVQLIKSERQISPPGTISSMDCDRNSCRIMVVFPESGAVRIAQDSLVGADLVAVSPAKTP